MPSALATFPLHPITPTGLCGCGDPACSRVGKHAAVLWGSITQENAIPPEEGRGYGIRTGAISGLFVVDIDSPDALLRFEALDDTGIFETLTISTSKGWHLYFEHPGFHVPTSQGQLAKGIDIRGDGGFVVGPGSPHASGITYSVLYDDPIAPAPEWLLEWLRASHSPAEITVYEGDVEGEELARNRGLYASYLQEAPPAIAGQAGDTQLFRVVQRGALDLAMPFADVHGLIAEIYNPRCVPPWSPEELYERVRHKCHSAKTQSTRPALEPAPPEFLLLGSNVEDAPPVKGDRLGFVYGAWDEEPEETEFLIDGILPRGAVALVYGRADSLKTWMLYSMAHAMASGEPWLGHATRKSKVGIVDYETGHKNLRKRLYFLRAGKNPNLGAVAYPALKPNDREFWIQLAREDLDVVIVDSLRRGNQGADENDSKEAIIPLEHAQDFSELTEKRGHPCAVIYIHHAKKASGDGWPEFRGSVAIEDQVDCMYAVRKLDGDGAKTVEVRCEKPGDMKLPPPFAVSVEFDDVAKTASIQLTDVRAESKEDPSDRLTDFEIRAEIKLVISNAEQDGAPIHTRKELEEKVRGRAARIRTQLEALIASQEVSELEGMGYVVDSPEKRLARIVATVRARPRPRPGRRWTPSAVAKASTVTASEVETALSGGVIFESGDGSWGVR